MDNTTSGMTPSQESKAGAAWIVERLHAEAAIVTSDCIATFGYRLDTLLISAANTIAALARAEPSGNTSPLSLRVI